MTTKNQLLATLVGFIVLFLLGWLFYGFLLMDFYTNNTGSASGVMRSDDDMIWWALLVGNLFQTYFLVFIYSKMSNIDSFMSGLKIGAILGFIWGLAMNLSMYGTTNIMNINSVVVDPFVSAIMIGITGGVIGAMLGRK